MILKTIKFNNNHCLPEPSSLNIFFTSLLSSTKLEPNSFDFAKLGESRSLADYYFSSVIGGNTFSTIALTSSSTPIFVGSPFSFSLEAFLAAAA